ncbi:hypothetical protein [Aneurinibacillus tyrosinisolvens]|uniref:hypothetical protein n=1 Tax=Aneurinibacillus tyrosinisolvens TaxID=1443435 RepID=UPI000A999472|nr:hypothetical protein [Aneurinibacillus tyrosinisolvens]
MLPFPGVTELIFMGDLHAALRHHQMNENGSSTSLTFIIPVYPFNTAGEGRSFDYGALSRMGD